MTPVLSLPSTLPSSLFRLRCHLKSLLLPSSIPTLKALSSSLALDTEETPAMKALKDIPYPSASPDPSIFESWSDDYDGVRLPRPVPAPKSIKRISPQSANQRHNASRVLEQLSRSGKFGEAEQVRQELVEMNVPIRPSSAYYRVAWSILRQRPWPQNRPEILANWLSLLPSMASDEKPLDFVQLRSALLSNSPHLDLKTVSQFGIILSSKGYIRDVGPSVVACLTRYADPDLSSRILGEMIAADDDYRRSRFGTTDNASTRKAAKKTTRRLWSIAVRTHCTAGRPEVAFQMARRAHEHDFQLTKFTYEYLLGKLDADGLDDLAAELRASSYYGSVDVAKSRLVDVSNPTSVPPISPKQSMFMNQAIALVILRRGSQSGLPAYAVDLVPYFNMYKKDLRGGGAVNMLRSRAYRISRAAASTVLIAELLHHHRRGQFRHVLWVFEKFFHVVGVPSEDIARQLWKREHYPPQLHIHHWSIPSRITRTTFNLPSRIWPTSHQTALVWSALVHLCESEEELFALYDSLLQHSARFQKTTVGHHPSHGSSVPAPVPAPTDKFDAAHFRPFLIAFTHLRDAKYGLHVLDDMQDRGILPSVQILSTAAALQARHGEPALALRMLDIIRGLVERDGDKEAMKVEMEMEIEMGAKSGVEAVKRVKKQRQLLTAYTGVLRGLVDRRNIVQARQVAELLHSHLGYVEGRGGSSSSSGNARTDAALRYLRRLEVEGLNAIPESFTDSELDGCSYHLLKKRDPEVCLTFILFYFLKLHPITPFDPPSFPIGKNVFANFFFFPLRLMEATAQVIRALNAAPGANRD